MTNNLNSVIIEGKILSITKYDDRCHFTTVVRRHYRTSEGIRCEDVYINVFAQGRVGEICNEKLDIDKVVRVVGRLVNVHYVGNNCGSVEIYAEHVEDKPFGKEEEDAEED